MRIRNNDSRTEWQSPEEKKEFYRRLGHLALPIALQSLMLAAVAAADALMLGQIDAGQMTAVSLATQIQFVQNMILSAVTAAGGILGAQYWGKGDRKTLQDLFNMILRFCGLVSILFFAACELVPGALMHIFSHDEEIISIGSEYLRIAGWSYLLTGISQCYMTIMKVTDHVTPSSVISSGAVLMNIGLNALLIFGMGMEARGAAAATTIARACELAACVGVCAGKTYIRPGWERFFRQRKGLGKDYLHQVLPLLGGGLLWGIGFTSYTAVIGHMGTSAATANSVASVVRDLICCVCNGIGAAAGIIVGNELGAGRLEQGKRYGIRLKNISWVIGFGSTAVVLALTPLVVRMVKLPDEAAQYLTGMMIIMAVYMIGRCVNTVTINGVLDGGGDTKFDAYSLAVCMWGIAVPLAFLGAFVFHWPVLAVYACTCLDEVGKLPWVMARLRKYKWVRDLTRSDGA